VRGRQLKKSPRVKGIETNGLFVLGEGVIELVAVVVDVPKAVLGMGVVGIPGRDLVTALRTGQAEPDAAALLAEPRVVGILRLTPRDRMVTLQPKRPVTEETVPPA
jgi:hypothetical protein